MPYTSRRDHTTQEERVQQIIDRKTPNNKLKMSEYLSQPNVKAFNSIITQRMLDKMDERVKKGIKGRPQLFKSIEECQEDIGGYFKLCYDYNMIPTVASFCTYIGSTKEYVYDHINNPSSDFADLLKVAVSTILSYQETGVMSNEVPSVPFIFLGKNYHGFKDTQDVNLSATNQTQTNPNTLNAIKDQIALEKDDHKIIDVS